VFVTGDTVMPALLPRLFDHAYKPAPVAVRVVLVPLQTVVIPLMTARGSGFTVTVAVSLSVQPLLFVTVTVYVVAEAGDTLTTILLPSPPDQVYVLAPEAVRVVLAPLHIDVAPLITAVGSGFTTTVAIPTSVQLLASVIVTV
jgi:hypothetical protein